MASLKEMRDAANAWAAQEKADLKSGVKKAPLTSREKLMADEGRIKNPGKNPTQVPYENSRMHAQHIRENYSMKTALVRETESGRNRGKLAQDVRAGRAPSDRLQAAAETGEAQAFVGIIKPNKSVDFGDAGRQGAQVTRDLNTPQKDLGRAVVNTISRDPEGAPSLLKIAKGRAAKSISIAGPDPKPTMRASLKSKFSGGSGGAAPAIAPETDLHAVAINKGWNKIKAIHPGDLPHTD